MNSYGLSNSLATHFRQDLGTVQLAGPLSKSPESACFPASKGLFFGWKSCFFGVDGEDVSVQGATGIRSIKHSENSVRSIKSLGDKKTLVEAFKKPVKAEY